MNELRRMAYLEAMGIPGYVSRSQLPGAATTRRLTVVSSRPCEPAGMPIPTEAIAPGPAEIPVPRVDSVPRTAARAAVSAGLVSPAEVPHFSLAAVVSGGWLWLEELDGMPLAREQVQLVQAMARALERVTGQASAIPPDAARPSAARPNAARPEVALFDWPIHNNRQLDQGEDAARAGVAGFVGRKLEQFQCRGLVLLGPACASRLPLERLDGVLVGSTVSSASMLAEPGLKKQAWLDLQSLAARL